MKNVTYTRLPSGKHIEKEILPKKNITQRNFGLDLMRFIAIMLVIVSHGIGLFYTFLFPMIGNNLLIAGHWGVQLFFVLSGFQIGSILIKEVMRKDFGFNELLTFWKRRWFRTLPNYYF